MNQHNYKLKINTPITTIPGIGDIIGTTILAEIGDIERFSNPSKLVAYAGIDASVHQSGDYISTNNKMSKRTLSQNCIVSCCLNCLCS